jgi:colanic acid biosynthesis glycosyl transferase WcaI
MKRRILVFNQYYAPGVESTAQLLTQLCEALARDYEITVITGVVEGTSPGREVRNGVEVVRVMSTAFERRKLALRATNYLTYVASSLWLGLNREADLVLCMSDPPFVPALARLAALRLRVPYVAIMQDVFPEIAVELGRLRNPVVVGVLRAIVGFGLRRAAKVVAIGETMRVRLVEKGVRPARIEVIRNWVDASAITPQKRINSWAIERALDDKFVVMHSGNVGYAQDLEVLVRAATFLRDLDALRIVIIGNGAKKLELMALAEQFDVPRVVFFPYQEREVLPLTLSSADIHLVALGEGLSGYIVPSRINGVMSVSRPMIVAADEQSEIVRLVEDARCGVTIPPGDPVALAGVIRDAYDNQYDLATMGARGRRYVDEELDRSVAVSRYRRLFQELLA